GGHRRAANRGPPGAPGAPRGEAAGRRRGEAMVGPANRRDERVLPALVAALGMDESDFGERYDLVLSAADELADPRLLPALLARRGRSPDDPSLEAAIESWSPADRA